MNPEEVIKELWGNMNVAQAEQILKGKECPRCGLEAKTLLHQFCTHSICPIRKAFNVRDGSTIK